MFQILSVVNEPRHEARRRGQVQVREMRPPYNVEVSERREIRAYDQQSNR